MNKLLSTLRAAGEITRLRMLSILSSSELTVSELVEILDQSQPRVSRHLKRLCDCGLLERYQEGARVFHRIADAGESAVIARKLIEMINPDDPPLVQDQIRLKVIKSRNAELAATYFSKNASEWDSIRSRMASDTDIEKWLVRSLNPANPDLLLDLGTGTGRMLEIFSPHIKRGIGIDLNREMLLVARSNLDTAAVTNCTVRQNDIHRLNFPDQVADVITIHQVLHYLDDPDRVIKEAIRVLKPHGQLLIVDFLPHDLEFLREQHAHRRLGIAERTLRQWCHRYGCTLVEHEHLSNRENNQNDALTAGLWSFRKIKVSP